LAAFLLEGTLTSPILFGAFGHVLGELGPFLLFAHGFRTAAFAAFLYLSLQYRRSIDRAAGNQELFASTSASHFLTSSTAPGSSRVVVSPISCPETRDRITRRMIFPLRVFGNFSVM